MLEKQIGAGSFSTVWHARHRANGTEVAIKEIFTSRLNYKLRESLKSEIFILKKINHPNVIRLHDMIEEQGKMYIVLEYRKGGDLSMYINQHHGRIPEAIAKHFMQQLVEGLKILRENNLIHRDLKPQQALHICHAQAASAVERSLAQETTKLRIISKVQHNPVVQESRDTANTKGLVEICSQIERAFLYEVGSAEELAKVVVTGEFEMPDPMELISRFALAFGRHAAVDEYMGDTEVAVTYYSKAIRLLTFLLVEAPSLVLNPPFSLKSSDRNRIQNYTDVFNKRQRISESRIMAVFKSEDQPTPP